jgi:hypothetical protein
MMEAVGTSETSVDDYFTRQYIPEDNSEEDRRYTGEDMNPGSPEYETKVLRHSNSGPNFRNKKWKLS